MGEGDEVEKCWEGRWADVGEVEGVEFMEGEEG